jgi:hypothetical protein
VGGVLINVYHVYGATVQTSIGLFHHALADGLLLDASLQCLHALRVYVLAVLTDQKKTRVEKNMRGERNQCVHEKKIKQKHTHYSIRNKKRREGGFLDLAFSELVFDPTRHMGHIDVTGQVLHS